MKRQHSTTEKEDEEDTDRAVLGYWPFRAMSLLNRGKTVPLGRYFGALIFQMIPPVGTLQSHGILKIRGSSVSALTFSLRT